MPFQYTEDQEYFYKLLCDVEEDISNYTTLFDFRPLHVKRQEFNAQRSQLITQLTAQHGRVCQLRFPNYCDMGSGVTIDHLIPLSSNKLNKELRHLSSNPGRKVPSQSFGSNHVNNMIIACRKCNNHKKHRFLERQQIKQILATKFFKH